MPFHHRQGQAFDYSKTDKLFRALKKAYKNKKGKKCIGTKHYDLEIIFSEKYVIIFSALSWLFSEESLDLFRKKLKTWLFR